MVVKRDEVGSTGTVGHAVSNHDEKEEGGEEEEEEVLRDYLYDDNLGLYYAGDFCSRRTAGVEAACLSGLDVANHVHDFFKK